MLFNLNDLLSPTQYVHPQNFVGDERQFAMMLPQDPAAWRYFDQFMATRARVAPEIEETEYDSFLEYVYTWAIRGGMQTNCAQAPYLQTQQPSLRPTPKP